MSRFLNTPCRLLLACVLFGASPARAQEGDVGMPTSEEVKVTSGGVTLAASVRVPPGEGPFPGVVIVHGSGSSDRSNPWTTAYADALVARGVAVLHPDKRGAGASGGDWRTATFLDLAGDAVAAVEVLRSHPGVDPDRVGVIGFSQGGQIVPAVAAASSSVAFVIDVSGALVPILEQIGDEILLMGEREGLQAEDLEVVRTVNARGIHYAMTGEGWSAYAEALAGARAGRMRGLEVVEGFPTEPDDPAWAFLRTVGAYDPLPYWRRVEVPSLFLFGGRDENVDVYKSVDVLEDVLTPDGLAYSLLLFRNNGHGLFREDALDFMARWIRDGGVD